MSRGTGLPPIEDGEQLARFVLFSKWVRTGDASIRPDAFIPYPWPELSVTRHAGISEGELWNLGQAIASQRPATLYGRADIQALSVRQQSLQAVPTPEPKNHANIIGWPLDKPAQKIIAQELAAKARFVPLAKE